MKTLEYVVRVFASIRRILAVTSAGEETVGVQWDGFID